MYEWLIASTDGRASLMVTIAAQQRRCGNFNSRNLI
jgi:hypothetical protein